jgi:undecaprenyl-phosphate 4-deoxy-4-formamido-L-arabinose transferase
MIEIVVPLFNEEENVAELHTRLRAACNRLDAAWQVTFVDDGSTDRTVAAI